MKKFLLLVLMSIGVFLSCQKQEKPEDTPVVPESPQYPMGLITNSKANASYPEHLFERGNQLPFSLTLNFPQDVSAMPYYNQLNMGSAPAFACSVVLSYAINFNKRGMSFSDADFFFSPSYLFNQTRLDPKDCLKGGATIGHTLALVESKGVPPVSLFPYNTERGCNTQPSKAHYTIAARSKIRSFATIKLDYYSFRAAIKEDMPIIIGANIPATFMNLFKQSGEYIYTERDYTEDHKILGRHAMVVVGYDATKGENGVIKVLNSWGRGGNKGTGYVEIDAALIGSMIDEAFVIDGLYDKYAPFDEDPKPDPNPIPDPDPKPTPDPAPDPKPAPDPAPKPDPAPQPNPDPKPDPAPTPDPSPQPDPTPDPQPSPDPAPKPDPVPDPQPSPDPAPQPDPVPDPGPDPKPSPDPAPKPEPQQTYSVNPEEVPYLPAGTCRVNQETVIDKITGAATTVQVDNGGNLRITLRVRKTDGSTFLRGGRFFVKYDNFCNMPIDEEGKPYQSGIYEITETITLSSTDIDSQGKVIYLLTRAQGGTNERNYCAIRITPN